MKRVTVVILTTTDIPDDWDVQKLDYHLRKGYVALGDMREVHDKDEEVADYINIEEAIVQLQ